MTKQHAYHPFVSVGSLFEVPYVRVGELATWEEKHIYASSPAWQGLLGAGGASRASRAEPDGASCSCSPVFSFHTRGPDTSSPGLHSKHS